MIIKTRCRLCGSNTNVEIHIGCKVKRGNIHAIHSGNDFIVASINDIISHLTVFSSGNLEYWRLNINHLIYDSEN